MKGTVAIVTGAGQGIGRATAHRLSAEGCLVAVNDVNAAAARSTADEIAQSGGTAIPAVADVTSDDAVTEMVAVVERELGPVGVLVNNAGGSPAEVQFGGNGEGRSATAPQWRQVTDTPTADFEAFLRLNLTSMFICARAVLPTMIERRAGRIVCVSSIVAATGQRNGAGYAAGKAGVHALVASLSKEVGPFGIGVNGIVVGNAPHPVRQPERQVVLDEATHLGRGGRYEEFAAALTFLAGPDSSYISGAMIPVDGGTHLSTVF